MLESYLPLMFLGNAPRAATLNLGAQILMGLVLLIGMILARKKLFRAHGICQTIVVLINPIPIFYYMSPVFRRSVLPKFPLGATSSSFYLFPSMHAVIGSVAEILGLYIILRAGTDLLPKALRFDNYKLWMRATLALWWIAIVLGVATFTVWHLSEDVPVQMGMSSTALPSTITITMKNFEFDPKEVTVSPGTTVVWKGVAGKHSIKADGGGFESEIVPTNGEFNYKFEKEGRYSYYCTLHGEPGGKDMAGVVIVAARTK